MIDGVMDADITLQEIVPLAWTNPDTPLPQGHSAQFAVGWRPDGLYFYVQANDPDRNPSAQADWFWLGDGLEIQVDSDGFYLSTDPYYDDPGTRHMVVRAPATDDQDAPISDGILRFPGKTDGLEAWPDDWIARPVSGGYVLEAFVGASTLNLPSWSLGIGSTVGFDITHNVSLPVGEVGAEGNRLGQYFLSILEPATGSTFDLPYVNSAAFCTAILR